MRALLSKSLAVAGLLVLLGCSRLLTPAFRLAAPSNPAAPVDCSPIVFKKIPDDWVTAPEFGWHVFPDGCLRRHPVFNPYNPDEVAYRLDSGSGFARRSAHEKHPNGIWVVNLRTKQQHQLPDSYDTFDYQPRPGNNYWLTCKFGTELWGLNGQNGGRRLLINPAPEGAKWSPDGRQLVSRAWETGAPQGPFTGHLLLSDTAGHRILAPVLEARAGLPGPWSPDGRWLLLGAPEAAVRTVCLYEFATGNLQFVRLPFDAALPWADASWVGAAWLPDSQGFVWCIDGGLYRTSLATGITTQLRAVCIRQIYEAVSVASDGQQMVLQRADQRIHSDSLHRHRATNLWTMNLDGSNERKMVFRKSRQRK